jgi:cholesterol oxidase
MTMPRSFDVIVVGSGFGGAVTACRLAEAGARVLVLERGHRWTPDRFPRKLGDEWLYAHDSPEKFHGWLDLRFFKRMAVAQGAGVGGGSLCYSSVLLDADSSRFESGWPPEITVAELEPYYQKARKMLGARPIPEGQRTARYKLARRAAERSGLAGRYESLPLAISFDEAWNYDLPDPINAKHSRSFDNAQGVKQGTCVHLGNCDLGCDVHAKNTLDLNYIPAAEARGAEVRPLHLVRSVTPAGSGYRVDFDRINGGRLVPGYEEADRVVLSAGSLGTTEILLRCRNQYRTLKGLSPQLGRSWSANANVLTPDQYDRSEGVHQSIGPTISGGIDFTDGPGGGPRYIIEDDGFPNLLLNALEARAGSPGLGANFLAWALRSHLKRGLNETNPLSGMMMWLGAGCDASDGVLKLGRKFPAFWKQDLSLSWDVTKSKPVIDAILATHRRLSEAAGGRLLVPLYWRWFRSLVTVHPLGGCRMGRSTEDGVVNHAGEVFGHRNLFVADGSLIPVALGRNPSLTIAALAERSSLLIAASEGSDNHGNRNV